MSGHDQIRAFIDGFEEMIKFMDFSFERAFQQKDKEFMLGYRDHIKLVQDEIEKLKAESNESRYQMLKQKKIEALESKLALIRKQALFLGDMSEMHNRAIKEKKLKADLAEGDKSFFQNQLLKHRDLQKRVKAQLHSATSEYDELYT